jgi:CHAT domain-containing protein
VQHIYRYLHSWVVQRLFNRRPSFGRDLEDSLRYLSENLWEPVFDKIDGDREFIYIIPDGTLAELPFEMLFTKDEKMLIESKTIGYLELPHGIIRMADKDTERNSGFIAVGGVDFDNRINEDEEKSLIASKGISGKQMAYAGTDRGAVVTRGKDQNNWVNLRGTVREVSKVIEILKDKSGTRLSGGNATKNAVSALMQGKRYIYLATHGHFDETAILERADNPLNPTPPVQVTKEHDPMRTSYLVFAGANKEKESAYLSAAEIMTLDLRGTELTVLSACQTGSGSKNSGEGVMGLRRAFIGAGSKGLVMSLWKVDDTATADLMTKFMKKRIEEDNNQTVNAMREAKLKMLQSVRYNHPYYWAPFVVTGR